MKIAVLGGGNGSFAAAGDFALQGHDVRLWRRDAAAVAEHRAAGSRIVVKDSKGRHDAQLSLVTTDIAEAVRDAELILCPAPAFAQHDIAAQLAPHLGDGQVVFLPPATFGSMIFAKAAHDARNHAAVAFAETGTLPWLTRKHGPFEVAITIRAKRLPVGVFPLEDADRALDVIGCAFPGAIEPCGDALSGALMNAGPIIHPPLIVMNAGPIEHFERWDIHKEGTQAAIRRVTDALDAERIAVRQGFGYGPPHFPLAHHYAKEGEEWMYGRGSHDRLTDSGDWRERIVLTEHRYMREDLRLGLSFLVSVAELAGAATPLAKAFLAIGGAICGEDFMQRGRTLQSLGFGGLDRDGLQTLLGKGFPPMTSRPAIACLGAGRMGRGIAVAFAYAGHRVTMIDVKPRSEAQFATLEAEALGEIRKTLASLARFGLLTEYDADAIIVRVSLAPAKDSAAALAGAAIVFEGVPEVVDLKREVLASASKLVGADVIIASTTSTILVDDISGAVEHPQRFLNVHWLNPAYLIPLVELSPGAVTDPAITAQVKALLEGIGKVPVVCAATPGYIVPRIQALAMNEAARMVEEGVASAEDIDKAIKYGFGFRYATMGLLEFIDWGGGDILYYASRYLEGALHSDRYRAPEVISRNMEQGRIGMRTGAGFLDYAGKDIDAWREQRLAALVELLRHFGLARPPVL